MKPIISTKHDSKKSNQMMTVLFQPFSYSFKIIFLVGISDFLRQVYPKSYSASIVNRNIGQVAIETRGSRHRQNDNIVLSILTSADDDNIP